MALKCLAQNFASKYQKVVQKVDVEAAATDLVVGDEAAVEEGHLEVIFEVVHDQEVEVFDRVEIVSDEVHLVAEVVVVVVVVLEEEVEAVAHLVKMETVSEVGEAVDTVIAIVSVAVVVREEMVVDAISVVVVDLEEAATVEVDQIDSDQDLRLVVVVDSKL